MTRGRKVALTFVMAGMIALAAVHDAGAWQGVAGPFRVRVVDAQHHGVATIKVDVMTPDLTYRSFTTDKDGLAAIAREVAVEGAFLTVKRSR